MQHRTTKIIPGVGLHIQTQERTTNKEQNLLKAAASIFITQSSIHAKFLSSK